MKADSPARPVRRILAATDFSACSDAVMTYAASLARMWNATLFLAHVASPELISVEPPVTIPRLEPAKKQMQDLEVSDEFDGIEHACLIAEGPPAETLLKMARENEVDLILMGTHGRTGLRRLVMGSVAERVFREAECPVMTLGPGVFAERRREAHISRVLCAVGALDVDHSCVRHAIAVAQQCGAALTLVHIAPSGSKEDDEQQCEALRAKLIEMVPAEVALAHAPESVVEVGTPSECIVRIAAERDTDLIVIGALPPALLTPHLMDTAYRVIVEAPCPVMTVLESHQRVRNAVGSGS